MAVDDKDTLDMLPSAKGKQARYRANKAAQGFFQKTIWLNRSAYETGRQDATRGIETNCPDGTDLFSWCVGFWEVQAQQMAEQQDSVVVDLEANPFAE